MLLLHGVAPIVHFPQKAPFTTRYFSNEQRKLAKEIVVGKVTIAFRILFFLTFCYVFLLTQ